MAFYAVGDIHGYLDKLKSLIDMLPLTADDKLIFLGDYIDRGPDSKGVISFLLEIREQYDCVFLIGNHEHMMLDYMQGCLVYDPKIWMWNGGDRSLQSYGIEHAAPGELDIPGDHLGFLKSLAYYHQEPGFVFVHAGLQPNLPLEQNRWTELLWIRSAFYQSGWNWPEGVVVFGHTPFTEPLVETNKIGIDTGCGWRGSLTAVRLPEIEFYRAGKGTNSKA